MQYFSIYHHLLTFFFQSLTRPLSTHALFFKEMRFKLGANVEEEPISIAN
jgi:hypothetical protein